MSNVAEPPKLGTFEYRVVRSLGTGAGSTILMIEDTKNGRRLALKVVKRHEPADDVYINQAIHEFDVARRLNHPGLLKIFDMRVKKGWFKTSGVELLMEYVQGDTLDELGVRDIPNLVLIFLHVCSAMKHMHRRGIYHGDLKPSNIMLSTNRDVRVLDFWHSVDLKGQPKDRVQGTPQYMAPEQAIERTVGEKTDIYNFGATMYRLLTGDYANMGLPAVGNGALGLMRPKRPKEYDRTVPTVLDETIMSCLQTSPERRPESFHEIKHRLVAVAKELGLDEDDSS